MNEDELVNDFTIFKYLPPKDNCIFSNLKGYDLQELFVLENKYQLELRDSINSLKFYFKPKSIITI